MTSRVSAIPDGIYYHFASKPQSIDELILSLYNNPASLTIDHFKTNNSHLKDGRVQSGQLIIISPPDNRACTQFEADLSLAAEQVDLRLANLPEEEKRITAENFQLLSNIASTGGAGYGVTLIYFSHHVKAIESTLKEIERLYAQTYNSTGKLNSPRFLQQRKQLFMRMDNIMASFLGGSRTGFTSTQTKIKNSLGLNTKSILHQWKQQSGRVSGVPGFVENYNKTTKLAATLKAAGYVGVALDVGQSASQIHAACTVGTEKQCTKTSFGEGGRLVGSVGGGGAGAAVGVGGAYVICNIIFGLQTAGTSLMWCGIAVTSAGGYAGSSIGGDFGKERGELLYKKTVVDI